MQTKERKNAKQQTWEQFVAWTTQAANLSEEEAKKLKNSLAAKIIVATARISGCSYPKRIIVSHLCTLMADVRNKLIFGHKAGESLEARLEPVNFYPGGDPIAVKAGMLLLKLLSLNDHKYDIADDILAGKQNPLIVDMDYQAEKADILQIYFSLPGYVLRRFDYLYQQVIKADWWWNPEA
jgi:hypothetical protein